MFLPHIIVVIIFWFALKMILSSATGNKDTKNEIKKSNEINKEILETLKKNGGNNENDM